MKMLVVRVTVRTGAMDVQDEMSNDDRKKLEQTMYEALEVQRFPIAVYETKQIAVQKQTEDLLLAHAIGTLSFHGVTQTQSLDARVTRLGTMLQDFRRLFVAAVGLRNQAGLLRRWSIALERRTQIYF